ncbi:unnamed protein product, partial [Prorocentrum cordatum]
RARAGGSPAEPRPAASADGSSGTLEFGLFAAAVALVLPLLGPRVPDSYHRTEALLSEVRRAAGAHGEVAIQVEEVRDPLGTGEAAPSLTVATAFDESRAGPPRARMLVVANEHARELVTGEIALGVVERLASAGGPEPGSAALRLRALLRRGLEITVVPVASPEGRALAETWRPCQRGTADVPLLSTDLNRNFPFDWTPGLAANFLNSSLELHGTAPFSAYQARVIRAVAERHQWDAFVDLHSGARSLNLPYGRRAEGSSDLQEQLRALEGVRSFCPDCRQGPARAVMGYDNPGQLMDWMYEDRGVKYSYVWEVFAATGLCAPHFNPVSAGEPDRLVEQWCGALAALGEYVLEQV